MKKAITFAIALILSMCTSITAFAEGESVVYFDSGFDYHHRVSINFPFDAGITSSTEKSSVILFSSQPVQKIDGTAHFIVTHPNSDKPVPPSVENKSSTSDRDKWITTFMIRATNANGLNIGETSAPETMTVTLTDGNTMDIACTLELTDIPSIFWRNAETGAFFKGSNAGSVGKEISLQACIRDEAKRYNSFSIEWELVTGDAKIVKLEGTPGSVTEGMRTSGIVPPEQGKEFVGSTITILPQTANETVRLKSRLYDPDGNGLFPYWDIGFRVEGSLQEFENLDDVKDAIQNGAPVAIPPNTGLSANNISELKAALESGTLSNSEVVLSSQQDAGCNLQMSFDLNDPAFDSSKVRIPFTPAYTAAMPEEAKGSGISQVGSQWLQFSYSGEPPAPMTVTLDIDPNSTLGSASQIIIWRYNGVGEMQLVTSANVQKNADGKNIKATFVLDHFSTYALYQEGVNPNPTTSTGGSSGGSGGGSGSRLFADKNTQKQQPQLKTLSVQEAQKLAESALTEAKAGGTKQGIVRVLNIGELSRDVLNTIANTAKTQSGKLMIHADTVANKVVTGRLYLDPANTALTAPIATGIQIGHASTESIFRKHFQNKITAFELAQSGAFGANIEVAVKLDLTGWDISKIKLYSYHATSNTYMLLNNAAPFVDANGYLHMTTGAGGVVVISEGLLKAL